MIAEIPKTLSNLARNESATVLALSGDPAVRQRLGEMGLTRGSQVRVIRAAPLGDPVQVQVRSYLLSLRRSETGCVLLDAHHGISQPITTIDQAI